MVSGYFMSILEQPALALLEFESVAVGIRAGDAMVKRAPIDQIYSGTVQPGHYLVMVTGDVASVEEAVDAGQIAGGAQLTDQVYLPHVHRGVVRGLIGGRELAEQDAMGVLETTTVAAAIVAADAGLKAAEVNLWQLRLADGLGGKGLALFSGRVEDVEAAMVAAVEKAASQLKWQVIIPQLHDEMRQNMARSGRFGDHFEWKMA